MGSNDRDASVCGKVSGRIVVDRQDGLAIELVLDDVERIVSDPAYDGQTVTAPWQDATSHVPLDERDAIARSAATIWRHTVRPTVEAAASRIAEILSEDPDIAVGRKNWGFLRQYVDARLAGSRGGLQRFVRNAL